MANKSIERGKIIVQKIHSTIFDVRQVPKYLTDSKTGVRRVETSSMCLFVGKNKVKSGFKNIEEAGKFVLKNLKKYNKKSKKFF